MTAIDSITACLAHAPKKCTQSGNFQFDINYSVQNTASTRKLKTLFQKYKLELTTGIHVCIDHTFLNIQEIKMPRQLTATKTSHEKWIPIFSVSIVIIPTRIAYFVKCKQTLLELNFYQPYPSSQRERKFWHSLCTFFTKREISLHVRTHEKNSKETVCRLGTITQSNFCAQSGASICSTVWKWSGESQYPGALPPMIGNFGRAFSPGPTECP